LTQYLIYDRFTDSSTFAFYATTSPSIITTTVTSLTNGQSYDFEVVAQNGIGTSTPSNTVSSTPYTVPSTPTGVSAVGGNAQATVLFVPGSNGGSNVLYYTATSNPGNISATSTASPVIVSGLANGQSYTFTVAATNAAGSSANSSSSNSVTPNNLIPSIGFFTAAPLYIAPGSSSTLSWATTLATTVSISQGLGNQSATSTGSVVVSPASTTVYTLTASNANGTSTAQATVTVDGTPPSIPTSVTATAISASEIDLSWASSTDNINVAGYDIYQNGIEIATTSNTFYANTGLSASTGYDYYLDAFDAVGNVSATSTAVSATTQVASSGGSGGGGGNGGGGVSSGGGGGGGGSFTPSTIVSSTPSSTLVSTSLSSIASSPSGEESSPSGSGTLNLVEEVRSLSLRLFLLADNGGKTLTIGATGNDVWAIQTYLIMNNILNPSGSAENELTDPTSYFGTLTKNALAEYQAAVGISPASGILGSKTYAYLESAAGVPTSTVSPDVSIAVTSTPALSVPPVSLGSEGSSVTTIQNILVTDGYLSAGVFSGGIFDAATLRAVETFQCLKGIACSDNTSGYGTVGPKTRAALGM
jgi:peptidoglycan hydrolase-like protein with peptidoglycan-binding domain/uncharacterized membrane protein YgcG